MARFDEQKIKKILVIRPDMIGDVVLITPAISALRKKFTNAHITLLVQNYTKPVLEGNPDINEIIEDEIKAGKVKGPISYLLYVRRIRKSKFDLAVNYYVDEPKYALLPFLARIPFRIGDKAKLINGLFYNLGTHLKWRDIRKHVVELNLDLLKPLGITEKDPKIKIPLSPQAEKSVLEEVKNHGIQEKDLKVGLQLGTGGSNKSLSAEGYAKLADSIMEQLGAKVILTGGKREFETAEKVVKLSKGRPVNLAGKTSIPELISLFKMLDVFVSVDTGPMHIAAGLGTRIVAIFPTKFVKPVRWGPWGTENVIIRSKTKCKLPCFPRKCKENYCVEDLKIEEIVPAIDNLLKGRGNKTKEESFGDWLKKTLNIMIIINKKDDKITSRTISMLNILRASDYNVTLVTSKNHKLLELAEHLGISSYSLSLGPFNPVAVRKLYKISAEKNINIVHRMDSKGSLNINLSYIFSEAFYLTPAIPVKDNGFKFEKEKDIIDFYLEKLKKDE